MKRLTKRFRYEWVLLASSALFFLVSRYVIPRYEEMMNTMNGTDGTPWSTNFLILSIVLFIGFLIRVIWVIRRKSE